MQKVIVDSRGIYYGWTMLVAVSLAQVTSWGVLYYSFSVFLAPMNAELGWTIAQMTGAYSLALLISGVAAIPIGRWLDRYGPRVLMTFGSIAATLLVVGWALVNELSAFYLIWAGIGLIMGMVLYEPAFVIVATWFERKRIQALTLLTLVAGFASIIYVPLANWLVQMYGWRSALLLLAGLLALGTIPIHALMLRRRPCDLGLEPDGNSTVDRPADQNATQAVYSLSLGAVIRDASFWWTFGAFFLGTFATMAITVHLIPYLTLVGYSPGFAAAMVGLIGAMALVGRLIFLPVGTRLTRRYVIALIFLLLVIAFAVLLIGESIPAILIFVLLFGAGSGAETPARAALVADLYGAQHYGAISGVLSLGITFARSLAPVTAGLIYTWTQSYTPVFILLAVAAALAVVAALQTRPHTITSDVNAT